MPLDQPIFFPSPCPSSEQPVPDFFQLPGCSSQTQGMRQASPACPSRRAIRARKATVPRSSWRAARLLGSAGQTRETHSSSGSASPLQHPGGLTHGKSPATWGEAWQSPHKARLCSSAPLAQLRSLPGHRAGCAFPQGQEEPWHSPLRHRSQSPPAEASPRGEPSALRGRDGVKEAVQGSAASPCVLSPCCWAPPPRPSHGSSLSKGHRRGC